MTEPVIAAKTPAKVALEAGKDYWWCACGMSKNQPFCDGSHKGSGLTPMKFTADKTGDHWLCACTPWRPSCSPAAAVRRRTRRRRPPARRR
ncbi:MAG: CDGSH iron-sulfur domain-containing protein [Alphaproteobacteria bacterium]|nr:MAG: CDGSH iron-sulfur domain-containing protein [Alphaproteobacteria bacterium]